MVATDLPILRTSERGAWKRCPQKWYYQYRMGLTTKGKQADSRWFGIGVHIALAEWYQRGTRRGPHPAHTFEEWVDGEIAWVKTWLGDSYEESRWVDAAELGIAMMNGYVEHYGRDSQWDIISIEQPFRVRIIRDGKPVAIFSSRWDGVFRDRRTRLILLLENKTASQISTAYLEGDDQAMAYLAVANKVLRAKGVLKPGENIGGIQYNFLRKSLPDDRPENALGQKLNKNGDVSKNQPAARFVRPDPIDRSPAEMKRQLERISDEVFIMNLARSGQIPIMKSRTRDCTWCDYWVPCTLEDRNPAAAKEVIKASYTVEDPYKDIREGQVIKSAGSE